MVSIVNSIEIKGMIQTLVGINTPAFFIESHMSPVISERVPLPTATSTRQPIGMVDAGIGNPGWIHFPRRFCATKLTIEKTIVSVDEVMDIACMGVMRALESFSTQDKMAIH